MRKSTTTDQESGLRDAATEIEFALSALNEADSLHCKIRGEVSAREQKLAIDLYSVTPTDAASIDAIAVERNRLAILKDWVANAKPLRQAIQHLTALLSQAKAHIRQCAQPRCGQESTIHECFWNQRLVGLEMAPLENQIQILRNVSREVLEGMEVVLQARRGIRLSGEEIRGGVLQLGNGRGYRQLTPLERSNGVADE